MSEQQYRVIADRGSMADESWIAEGDRVTYGAVSSTGELVIVRIERPVPTTEGDAPFVCGNVEDSKLTPAEKVLLRFAVDNPAVDPHMFESLAAELRELPAPSLPTREQIAEVLYRESSDWKLHRLPWSTVLNMADPVIRDGYFRRADAVLALLQKGADQ